jgi:MFS family permease
MASTDGVLVASVGDTPLARRAATGTTLILLMCLAEILCMAGFATYSALLPTLSHLWGLSSTEAGIVGGMLFGGYIVAAPFLTGLTDRVDARRVYTAATIVAASGSLLFAVFADGFWTALLAQALFGIGFAGVFMPGLKALSDRIDERLQSRAVAMYTSLSGLGLGASYALAGVIESVASWRWAFALAAVGPVLASLLVLLAVEPRQAPAGGPRPGMLRSFAQVFANRPALGYIVAYAGHCWELYGLRAWMVAFLGFALARTSGSEPSTALGPSAVAAIIALAGPASSIGFNEVVARVGRLKLVTVVMSATFVLGCVTGLSWQLPFLAVAVCVAVHYIAVMADSGALNSGTVAAARPEQRGATLAVHSTVGFSAGLLAPVAFGLVLDLGGGAQSGWAWAAAFASLGLPGLLGAAIVRRLTHRHPSAQPAIVATGRG